MKFGFRQLKVYQKAYKLAMEIFEMSKKFPVEEKYSLTDQIRDLPGQFVQILLRHIAKGGIQNILQVK